MITERHSVCPLDCPDTCSLTVTVDDDRIVAIKGSHANPYTAGVLCAKVPAAYPSFVHGERRIRTPLGRRGERGAGSFERISWDEALETIYERFTAIIAAHGPQAILPLNYAGPHGFLSGGSMDLRFFYRLGASLLDRRPLCGGIRTEAWVGTFGTVPGMRPEQAEHARLIVAWGNNVTWSNLHLMPVINRAKKQGARLVVVDPRRTTVARQADLHIALRPGTDVVLAWAVAAELERRGAIDREFVARHVDGHEEYMALARRYGVAEAADLCGVPADHVRTLAEWYATISPAAISVGNGLERNQNGGSGIRAVFALPALAGKLGVPGGGLINGAGFAFPKTPARLQRPDLVPKGTRTLNIVDVGAHLLDERLTPPIKAVFIYNHNPVVVHPDQNRLIRGLRREDRQPRVRRHRVAGGEPLRASRALRGLRSALAAARRASHLPAGGRAAQHRDLSPPGRPLRLHRSDLQGERRRADGRGARSVRRAARCRAAKRDSHGSGDGHDRQRRRVHALQERLPQHEVGKGRAGVALSGDEISR